MVITQVLDGTRYCRATAVYPSATATKALTAAVVGFNVLVGAPILTATAPDRQYKVPVITGAFGTDSLGEGIYRMLELTESGAPMVGHTWIGSTRTMGPSLPKDWARMVVQGSQELFLIYCSSKHGRNHQSH